MVTPLAYAHLVPGRGRWNPWEALRAHPTLTVRFVDLCHGDAFYWPCPRGSERCAIALGAHLDRVERRCALAHELIHHERRGGCAWVGQPDTWSAIVARDEAAVDAEAARRLVPLDELAAMVDAMEDFGEPIEARHVGEEFDVTPAVAERAMRLLAEASYGERWCG
jgi:hypothetical protein